MSERSSSSPTSPTSFFLKKTLYIIHVLKERTSMGRSIRGVHLKEREKLFYIDITHVLL